MDFPAASVNQWKAERQKFVVSDIMKSFRDLQLPIFPMEGDEDDNAAPTALQFLDYLQRKQEYDHKVSAYAKGSWALWVGEATVVTFPTGETLPLLVALKAAVREAASAVDDGSADVTNLTEAIDRLWAKYHVDPSLVPRRRIQVDMSNPGIAKYSARLVEVHVPVLVLAYAKFANSLRMVRNGVDNLRRFRASPVLKLGHIPIQLWI